MFDIDRKKFLALVLGAQLGAGVVAGCGGSSAEEEEPTTDLSMDGTGGGETRGGPTDEMGMGGPTDEMGMGPTDEMGGPTDEMGGPVVE